MRWDGCGVPQLSRDDKEQQSQQRSAQGLAAGLRAVRVTARAASRHAGVPLAAGGLWFPEAGWIQPQSLVNAQLGGLWVPSHQKFQHRIEEIPRES